MSSELNEPPQEAERVEVPRKIAKRLPGDSFPHPVRGKVIPTTIENVAYLMEEAGHTAAFNVIKKRTEITDAGNCPVSINQIVSMAALHGLQTGLIHSFVEELAQLNPHNPVKNWILSKPWDGKDRLEAFYATVTVADDYPKHLKPILLKRWLLSAVAAVMKDRAFHARGVLTFQGGQGIGKTSWVASLVPDGPMRDGWVKLDHLLDPSNKDSITGAVEHWVVEIGELDSSFKRDIGRLKGFITNRGDKFRRPYARTEVEYDRRTVFAATVNEANFLVDTTGNNRFWTIAATAFEFDHGIDMQQLYAQLAVEFEAGEQWWLTHHEEASLNDYNQQHQAVSVVEDMVRGVINLDKVDDPKSVKKTASELLQQLGIKAPTNAQAREAGTVLRRLLGPPRRVNGRDKWSIPPGSVITSIDDEEF